MPKSLLKLNTDAKQKTKITEQMCYPKNKKNIVQYYSSIYLMLSVPYLDIKKTKELKTNVNIRDDMPEQDVKNNQKKSPVLKWWCL